MEQNTIEFFDNLILSDDKCFGEYICTENPSGIKKFLGDTLSIQKLSFYENTKMKNIKFLPEITSLPNLGFKNCLSLGIVENFSQITFVGDECFYNCRNLSFDSNVETSKLSATYIGNSAFKNCEGITELPNIMDSIGEYAFENCTGLTKLSFNQMNEIKDYAFKGCDNLTEIKFYCKSPKIGKDIVRKDIPIYYDATIENNGFDDPQWDEYYLIPMGVSSLTVTYKVDGKVVYIDHVAPTTSSTYQGEEPFKLPDANYSYVFKGWDRDLTNIVANITTNAVFEQTDMTNATGDYWDYTIDKINKTGILKLNYNVDSPIPQLETYPWKDKYVSEIIIDDNIIELPSSILKNCKQVTTMTIPFIGKSISDNETENSVIGGFFNFGDIQKEGYIEQSYGMNTPLFYEIPTSLKKVIVTKQTNIPYGAFSNCNNISSVEFKLAENISSMCFYNAIELSTLTLPNTLKSIDDYVFYGTKKLTNLVFPENFESFGECCFANSSVNNLSVPFFGKKKNPNKQADSIQMGLKGLSESVNEPWGIQNIATSYYSSPIRKDLYLDLNKKIIGKILDDNTRVSYLPYENNNFLTKNLINYASRESWSLSLCINKNISYIPNFALWGHKNYPLTINSLNTDNILKVGFKAFGFTNINCNLNFKKCLNIDDVAFYSAKNIYNNQKIQINETCNFGNMTFASSNCNIEFVKNSSQNVETTWGSATFQNSKNTKEFIVPTTIKEIPIDCFMESYFSKITIPSSVKSIRTGAFQNLQNCSEIFINEGVVNFDPFVFNHANAGYSSDTSKHKKYQLYLPSTINLTSTISFPENILAIYNTENENNSWIAQNGYVLKDNILCGILENDYQENTIINIPTSTKQITNDFMTTIYKSSLIENLTTIILPTSLEKIGSNCFGKTKIQEIDIPNSVTEMSFWEYGYCPTTLKTITLHDTTEIIGDYGYIGKVDNIILDSNSTKYIIENNVLYNKDKTQIYAVLYSDEKIDIQIPNTVTIINKDAFKQENINSITITEGTQLPSLNYLIIQGNSAEKINIPLSFAKTERPEDYLNKINITDSNKTYKEIYNENQTILKRCDFTDTTWFDKDNTTTSIVASDKILTIEDWFGQRMKGLITVDLSQSKIKAIPPLAFSECTALKTINLPTTVEEIDKFAFTQVTQCNSINLKDTNLKIIGNAGMEYFGTGTGVRFDKDFELPETLEYVSDFGLNHVIGRNTTIQLPNSLKKLGSGNNYGGHVLYNFLSKATAFSISEDNQYFCTQDGILYDKAMTRLVEIPRSKKFSPVVPASIGDISKTKNLLTYPYENTSKTVSGVQVTINTDGTITVGGTPTATLSYYLGTVPVTPGETYTMSGMDVGKNLAFVVVEYNSSGEATGKTYNSRSITFTASNEEGNQAAYVKVYIGTITSSAEVPETIVKPQLEIGKSATDFEMGIRGLVKYKYDFGNNVTYESDLFALRKCYTMPNTIKIADELSLNANTDITDVVISDEYEITEPDERFVFSVLNSDMNTLLMFLYVWHHVENLHVRPTNKKYISIDGNLYTKDGIALVASSGNPNKVKILDIPEGVRRIAYGSIMAGIGDKDQTGELKLILPSTMQDISDFVLEQLNNGIKKNLVTVTISNKNPYYKLNADSQIEKIS